MKLALIALAAFCLARPAFAAPDEKSAPPGDTLKFIELKHLTLHGSDRLHRVINMVQQLTQGKARIVSDPVLKTIALQGTADGVAQAEQLLRRFDTPAAEERLRQIQLTMYLVEASDQVAPGAALPSELTAATDQLRTAFGHKSYRLVDTLVMQGREGSEFHMSGLLPVQANPEIPKTNYIAEYKRITYNEAQKSSTVDRFRFVLRVPVPTAAAQFQFAESAILTGLTIKDGQKLVLGKLTKDHGERGMFLIVSTKVD